MKILALVTARGGSKRLPGKNARLLGGRPLIGWSIDVARGIPSISDILVSTDSPDLAELARASGAIAPWLRPVELATDTATSVEVALHALDRYEAEQGPVDGLLLLQPTSPFRSRASVLRGIELFRKGKGRPVIGFSSATCHPMWCFRIEANGIEPFVKDGVPTTQRSQDLPPAYVVNGAFYLVSPDVLRASRSFLSEEMVPLIMDGPGESIDIDTESDWLLAEITFTML